MIKKRIFKDLVFKQTKLIPRGKVSTYKIIAVCIGRAGAARAVGNSLNTNISEDIPCHRVVRSDGMVGGFKDGSRAKKKMLAGEGVIAVGGKIDLKKYLHRFK